jgi:integrase
MVTALGTPKRHPESGIYLFRKRVPERLKESVGKSEIKFSLRTRDPVVARIRNLEEMARLERAWSGFDGTVVDPQGARIADFECKSPRPAPVGASSEAAFGHAEAPPPVPVEAAPAKEAMPLRSVFDSYAREAELAPSTVKRWSPVVDRLIAHLGHDDAAAVSRADIVRWKDALLAAGMANITVRDVYLAAVKATFQFEVDQGRLTQNPAKEVKVRVRKALEQRDKGFDGKEAETILSATLRKPSSLISTEMAAARRWVPWICAYTGARVNEITPLTGRDFIVRDGIPMIRIRAENNKTRSFREVPLHGHLVEQGLLDVAKSRGSRPLFYDPRRSRGGKDSNPHFKKVGERLAEWVRSLGIDGRVAPNHGWRHRFSSVARFVAMPQDVRNIIQGHAGVKVADSYGETWPLVALREIEKLPRYAV